MNAGEIQAVKDFVDKVMPELVDAEMARLPSSYGGMVKSVVDSLMPQVLAYLDAKLAEVPPAP